VTGSRPAGASFGSQPDTRAAGSSRASRPRPRDATSPRSTPAQILHQADLGAGFLARWIISRQAQEAAAEQALTGRDLGFYGLQAVAGMMRIVPSNPSVAAFTSCPASWTWAPSRNPSITVPFMTTDPVTLLRTPLR
jgi:hypothetical protein